ncbi:MAG: hypothetical protein ACK5KL_19300 [Dysgonomonas sp.]
MKEIIGRLSFCGFDGNVGEVVEYDSKESYLEAIKKELDCNFDSFIFETLIDDPVIRKAAEDCVYDACGLNNPRTLDWYKKNRGK